MGEDSGHHFRRDTSMTCRLRQKCVHFVNEGRGCYKIGRCRKQDVACSSVPGKACKQDAGIDDDENHVSRPAGLFRRLSACLLPKANRILFA